MSVCCEHCSVVISRAYMSVIHIYICTVELHCENIDFLEQKSRGGIGGYAVRTLRAS
jgi:hypothetical protein